MEVKIPRIIHQIWIDKNNELNKNPKILDRLKPWIKSCQNVLSNYEYILWNGFTMREFMKTHFSQYLKLYDSYSKWIFRCDVFRYFVLYQMGGVYLDTDIECIESFDHLLQSSNGFFLSLEPLAKYRINNGLMASSPKHPFLHYVISNLSSVAHINNPITSTGPDFLSIQYLKYPSKDQITLIDNGNLFMSNQRLSSIQSNSLTQSTPLTQYTLHHYTSLWIDKNAKCCIILIAILIFVLIFLLMKFLSEFIYSNIL